MILISASAPGTTGTAAPQPTYPAVYQVSLQPATDIAQIHPLFFDESGATVANAGSPEGTTTKLMLTDPDSNEVVPFWAPAVRRRLHTHQSGRRKAEQRRHRQPHHRPVLAGD